MTITQQNYLDIPNLLINELVGDIGLFIILGLIVVTYFAVKNSMPYQVIIFNAILFVGLVTSYLFNSLLWMLTLMVIGISVYTFLPKLMNRN